LPPSSSDGLKRFLSSFPKILKVPDSLDLVDCIIGAHRRNKPVIGLIGGQVIKCGLLSILTHLMDYGIITALAFNGMSSIHNL